MAHGDAREGEVKGKLANGMDITSNTIYKRTANFQLPLPCITVCHHNSTGLYGSLSAQRLSERALLQIASENCWPLSFLSEPTIH